ncbi:MAG: RloB family protein [Oscillospiraceae bacterium]|nr:RloB family protein [Oscillospiraceae bacterium]
MPRERNGNRKRRSQFPKRTPDLGYYFIVTDTEETEKNYLYGLRDSLPKELQDRIVIKVSTAKTEELVAACEQADIDPQYRQCWIVFDRDRVVPFDKIIADAKSKDIKVGWSNPCIEIWFDAYFGKMPAVQDSVACCRTFASLFEKVTGQEYKKANQQIYAVLNQFGDEAAAIQTAESRLKGYLRDGETRPSRMCPGTTLHHLVDEIRKKTL